mmetsp:Transcript_43256/g.85679  ORF Transcript_43256/g.85679 Transcript_43256/m.85679 type:complete len:100 (-) Transcript_43256:1310-1609(-)
MHLQSPIVGNAAANGLVAAIVTPSWWRSVLAQSSERSLGQVQNTAADADWWRVWHRREQLRESHLGIASSSVLFLDIGDARHNESGNRYVAEDQKVTAI